MSEDYIGLGGMPDDPERNRVIAERKLRGKIDALHDCIYKLHQYEHYTLEDIAIFEEQADRVIAYLVDLDILMQSRIIPDEEQYHCAFCRCEDN